MWEIIREKHLVGFNDCNVYVNTIKHFTYQREFQDDKAMIYGSFYYSTIGGCLFYCLLFTVLYSTAVIALFCVFLESLTAISSSLFVILH